ncbi:hypothetical protein Tco_0716706 [Tanacetum coccineum]
MGKVVVVRGCDSRGGGVVAVVRWRWLMTCDSRGGLLCGVEVVMMTSGVGCGGRGGDRGGVMVAAVGRQPEEGEARGGEWIWGSGRSGHEDNIWFRPERSPENFSGGGGMVAGGGGWPEKMTGGGGGCRNI